MAAAKTDATGHVNIPVQLMSGNYNITASKYGFIPKTIELSVDSSDILGVQDYSFSDLAISGSIVDLDMEIYNYSHSDVDNIQVNLVSQMDEIEVISDAVSFSSLAANESFSAQFQFQIKDFWNNNLVCDLMVSISSSFGENSALIPVQISSPELIFSDYLVQNPSGYLIQNEEVDLFLDIENIGAAMNELIDVQLSCLNEAASINISSSTFGSIIPGETGTSQTAFSLIPANLISGEVATFMLEIYAGDTELQTTFFDIPIGIINQESPTFCDYGYYAIESSDIGNFETPQYNWIEIHPALGGNGALLNADHIIRDGYIKTINLPFPVRYFGKYYNKISICSEGWLAMGETDQIYFRNRYIPSGVGPAAMIAPFWDALEDGEIYVYHDTSEHKFIIEWYDWASFYDPSFHNTFEVVFYDPEFYDSNFKDSEILFQYKEIHNIDADAHYATIGIENEPQTKGLLITFAGIDDATTHPIQSETAILIKCKPNLSIPYLTANISEIILQTDSDTTLTFELQLFNSEIANSPLDYELTLGHFSRGISRSKSITNRNIEDDFITQLSGNYIPIMPFEMLFYLVHSSPDGEAINGIRLDFPEGFYVNSATDWESLIYNGETGNGAEISWGFGNGTPLSAGSPFSMKVDLTIESGLEDPALIEYYIEGDGSGSGPHTLTDIIEIYSSTNDHLWITYPNGGEFILPGIQDTICWTKYGDLENVKIEIQRSVGSELEFITSSTANDGEFPHIFNGPLSDECKLIISSLDEETRDQSDSLFSISALNITYPDENTVMSYNSVDSLLWLDIGGIEYLDIVFSADNGFTWTTLVQDYPNTGKYQFSVPGSPSENCLLRIIAEDLNVQNQSSRFTIVDSPVAWISSDISSGSIPIGGNEAISISVSTSNLNYGCYSAVIKLITSIGQILYIPVNLDYYHEPSPIAKMKLHQNSPNPFNPFTEIAYDLPNKCKVNLSVYNVRGQIVKTLVDEVMPAGKQISWWDGTDKYNRKLSSGVYFYKVKAGKYTEAKKMILIK